MEKTDLQSIIDHGSFKTAYVFIGPEVGRRAIMHMTDAALTTSVDNPDVNNVFISNNKTTLVFAKVQIIKANIMTVDSGDEELIVVVDPNIKSVNVGALSKLPLN